MLKQFPKIATITLLCFLLSACGAGQTSQSAQQSQSKDIFQSLPDTVTCIVQLSINPEFEIHVNDDGVIADVICRNDDAQAVCSNLTVTGKNYKDGVMELLTTAYQQGYIAQDSRVTLVAVRKSTAQYDVPFVTDEIVSDFTANVISISFDVQNETITAEAQNGTQSSAQNTPVGDGNKTDRPDSTTDENGNTVLYTYHDNGKYASVEVIRADGSSQKTLYNNDGTIREEHIKNPDNSGVLTYENGVLKTEEITHSNGEIQRSTYDAKGAVIEEYWESAEVTQVTTFENGVKTLHTAKQSDGTSHTVYYNASGIAVKGSTNYADGSWSETTYKDGKPHIEFVEGLTPEGHTVKNTLHPNGKIAETVDYYAHNGEEYIYRYDENGTMTESFTYDNYGCRIHTVYRADGTSTSVRTNEDGSTTVLN